MCSGSFLEVCVDPLDEDGLGLSFAKELALPMMVSLG